MIKRIQEGTRTATSEMQASVEQVGAGVRSAQNAGSSIANIQAGAGEVGLAVTDIAHALEEQSSAMGVIARSVEQVAQRSEANSAVAHQTSRAAQELQDLAATLLRDAARFKV